MRLIIFLIIILIIFTDNSESKKQIKNKIELNEKFLGSWNEQKQDIIGYYNAKRRIYTSSKISDKYKAENMIDGDINTCWATSVNGGIGEQILLTSILLAPHNHEIYEIQGIYIYNGYWKNKKLYYKNNRIKNLYLSIYRVIIYPIDTDKGFRIYTKNKTINKIYEKRIKLKDIFGKAQKIKVEIDLLEDYKKIERKIGMPIDYLFLFTIEDIYKGSKYNDLCVSEIKFIYK